VPPDARIWGINARQFSKKNSEADDQFAPGARHDLPTDVSQHQVFRKLVPAGKLAVAESGIHSAEELRAARDLGYDAALIGTAFLSGPRSMAEVIEEFARAFGDST
jgi:indole-3-glycerol phosphate synthase